MDRARELSAALANLEVTIATKVELIQFNSIQFN